MFFSSFYIGKFNNAVEVERLQHTRLLNRTYHLAKDSVVHPFDGRCISALL